MASSIDKSVKGATKIKAAPPKTKYIEHILSVTQSGEHGVAEVFRTLQPRLRDSTWTVVFKSLITVHLMIREGAEDVTLAYLAGHKTMLAIGNFSDAQTQGRNIRHYATYLTERARAYRETKCDWVRGAEHRLEKLSVDKGLLRQTETVQHQITALLKCDILENEPENEITITAFRMLVLDLLAMFNVINQAMINILGHFFEMSKNDAERSMEIYRNFTLQTDFVVAYLSTARTFANQTRVEVPKLKHAPVNLGKQLEDYLADPDFEINRRQYLAEQDAKKGKTENSGPSSAAPATGTSRGVSHAEADAAFPDPPSSSRLGPRAQPAKGPDKDLIDFFESIEQNQQPMATYSQQNIPNFSGASQFQTQPPQFQQTGFLGYQNPAQFQQQPFVNGFQPSQQQTEQQVQQVQANFTGAGFGGYTPQPFQSTTLSSIPQNAATSFQSPSLQAFGTMGAVQQQTTNPFRQSMMSNVAGMSGPSFPTSPPNLSPIAPQSTNPFKSNLTQKAQTFPSMAEHQFQQPQTPVTSPMQQSPTGKNPFARNLSLAATQTPPGGTQMIPQPTGNTNPFRQSAFINTATGSGWQNNQQPIGGGLDHLDTIPVFPRPAQQQPWQQ